MMLKVIKAKGVDGRGRSGTERLEVKDSLRERRFLLSVQHAASRPHFLFRSKEAETNLSNRVQAGSSLKTASSVRLLSSSSACLDPIRIISRHTGPGSRPHKLRLGFFSGAAITLVYHPAVFAPLVVLYSFSQWRRQQDNLHQRRRRRLQQC